MKTASLLIGAATAALFLLPFTHARTTVGQMAPDFALADTNGRTVSLSALRGKTVVLEWINYGCPFVQKHYTSGNMQKTQQAAVADGVVWLSVCSSAPGREGNLSPAEWNKQSAATGSAATAVLLDEDGKVGHLYGATNTPDLVIINPQGSIVYQGAIDSIASTRIADIEKAQNYVLAALADLKAGRPVATPVTRPYGCTVKYRD